MSEQGRTPPQRTPTQLDAAIDRAVREMMNVDTDPAFRSRVLARLHRRPRLWFRPLRLLSAGAAVAALLLAFVLMRTAPPDSPAPARAGDHPTERASPPSIPRVSGPAEIGGSAASRRPRALRTATAATNVTQVLPAGAVVATTADDPFLATVPLDRIEPLTVDPIRSPVITPAPIAIAPLTPIAAMEIAPLSPRIDRD